MFLIKIVKVKRFVAIFLVLGLGYFLFPYLFPAAAAQATDVCPGGFENLCKIDPAQNPNFFGGVVQIMIVIAIVVSVIFVIIGGIRWIMSGGDKAKVEQAKSTLTAAIVGLVISILGYFIVNLVASMLMGNLDLKSMKIPRLID